MKYYLSYSLNKNIRYKASSGGFCKEFVRFLIETKIVDKAIITVLGDDVKSIVPETIITNNINKIMSTKSNTIYDKTNPLVVLKSLKSNEKYVFVGLPCHILPVKKYCKKRNIKIFTISLFCNHTPNTARYYELILDKVGLTKNDLHHFEYRGSGWPGFVTIITNDNKEIKLKHSDCWANYKKAGFNMPLKCKKCEKFVSMNADICVGDAWLQRILSVDNDGTCIILSMNNYADSLINQCAMKGFIYLEHVNDDEFNEYYQRLIKYKKMRIEREGIKLN